VFFVSVGNIPSPICHAVEKIISFRLLKKGHVQVELCEIPLTGAAFPSPKRINAQATKVEG